MSQRYILHVPATREDQDYMIFVDHETMLAVCRIKKAELAIALAPNGQPWYRSKSR